MNKTQKDFYRFKYEQKLPLCIRHNLTEVSIHQVVNSKDKNHIRRGSFPMQYGYRRKSDNVISFVYHALTQSNVKMLRIALKRFPDEVLKQLYTSKDRYFVDKRGREYQPLRVFRGWVVELERISEEHKTQK